MILCRCCLTTDVSTQFVDNVPSIEAVLVKFNIAFLKEDLSDAAEPKSLTQLCEPCWTKIDDFHQFYVQIERMHEAYNQHFIKDDGTFLDFDCADEYYAHVANIHNVHAVRLAEEDKKVFEPFCIINVDDEKLRSHDKHPDYVEADTMPRSALSVNDEADRNCPSDRVEASQEDMLGVESMLLLEDVVDGEHFDDDSDQDYDIDEIDDDDDDEDDDDDDDYDWSSDDYESPKKSKAPTKATAKASPSTSKKASTKQRGRSTQKSGKKYKITMVNVLDENSKRLLEYVQMRCEICMDEQFFETFADVQTHYANAHNQRGYITCCNRKFRRIGRILQHCTWHDNPEAFKCDACSKCFQDNTCLRDHVTSMHIPVNERRFQCEQCNRPFAKQHLLNTHLKMKHTVKEERPFVCQEGECGQRFVLPAYLRLHTEKVHNKSDSRVCDVCARFFKCSKSYERHYQVEHTNIDQRVQCDLCQKWFKHLDTLKDHIRRHYAASETCKYCGRVSSNKKSLRLHIRNVHADIDESVKTRNEFPCTICEKIFKKKQTLREHMTLHTGEAYLYTCTFCSKTFRSSANMYAHRKRNHPREYEEKCVLAKLQKT